MGDETGRADERQWRIRQAVEDDIPVLVQMRIEFFLEMAPPDAGPVDALEQACREYMLRELPAGRFMAWLAEAGDNIAGCGGLVIHPLPPGPWNLSGREGYIMNIYTRPGWRRQGIARAIMTAILERLRHEGVTRVELHATEQGQPLYESLGFEPRNAMRLRLDPRPAADG